MCRLLTLAMGSVWDFGKAAYVQRPVYIPLIMSMGCLVFLQMRKQVDFSYVLTVQDPGLQLATSPCCGKLVFTCSHIAHGPTDRQLKLVLVAGQIHANMIKLQSECDVAIGLKCYVTSSLKCKYKDCWSLLYKAISSWGSDFMWHLMQDQSWSWIDHSLADLRQDWARLVPWWCSNELNRWMSSKCYRNMRQLITSPW